MSKVWHASLFISLHCQKDSHRNWSRAAARTLFQGCRYLLALYDRCISSLGSFSELLVRRNYLLGLSNRPKSNRPVNASLFRTGFASLLFPLLGSSNNGREKKGGDYFILNTSAWAWTGAWLGRGLLFRLGNNGRGMTGVWVKSTDRQSRRLKADDCRGFHLGRW